MSTELKTAVRKQILSLLRNQKEEERLFKSRVIAQRLLSVAQFKRSHTILFYASFDGEVDTFEMMKQAQQLGKTIALPVVNKDNKTMTAYAIDDLDALAVAEYGIKTPDPEKNRRLDVNEIDLVIVPGVAFDRRNRRLGRGAGYYDRFFALFSSPIPTIGLAFDFQVVDHLPHQDHDVPVSLVITN